jgi:hypothetical protein
MINKGDHAMLSWYATREQMVKAYPGIYRRGKKNARWKGDVRDNRQRWWFASGRPDDLEGWAADKGEFASEDPLRLLRARYRLTVGAAIGGRYGMRPRTFLGQPMPLP